MTESEKMMAIALSGCTFCPGIGTKRFAKDMARRAANGDHTPLTPRQTEYLRAAVIRFRRQIDPSIVEMAREEA